MMKRFLAVLAAAFICAAGAWAQNDEGSARLPDIAVGEGVFSAETLTYFAFSDHNLLKADQDFETYKGKANTEFLMNIVELRVDPYPTGRFAIGLDFDWDYFRLDNAHYWMPDGSGKVSILPMEGSGMKKIKKSRLSVRTIAVPVSFTQAFGKFSLRVGASAEYNFPGKVRFKGIAADGATVKEWKNGTRFAKDIKTNTFTYNFFGALSYEDIGFYMKYCPVQVFQEGCAPKFQTLSFGVIVGLGV